MCSSYEVPGDHHSWTAMLRRLEINAAPDPITRGAVRPTDPAPVVLNTQRNEIAWARWWLEGSWSSTRTKLTLFNARADHLGRSFWREMAESQRCLVPALAFYEWRVMPGRRHKQRVRIARADGEPFAMAGIWNRWNDRYSCTIVTTEPNDLMRGIHDRMPVILPREAHKQWNASGWRALDKMQPLLVPYAASDLIAADSSEKTPDDLPLFR